MWYVPVIIVDERRIYHIQVYPLVLAIITAAVTHGASIFPAVVPIFLDVARKAMVSSARSL
jgi:hypothetical protein